MAGRRNEISHNKMQAKSVACNRGVACHASASLCKYCNSTSCNNNADEKRYSSIGWLNLIIILYNMILPRGCAGCDTPDLVLCENCVDAFQHNKRAQFNSMTFGYRYSCGDYSGVVRHAILQWKDHADTACDKIFGLLIANLVLKVFRNNIKDNSSKNSFNSNGPILVVPMPSSSSSTRRRGRRHIIPIANIVAKKLCNEGIEAKVANIVRMNSSISSKSVQTSGSRGRSKRASHAFCVNYRKLKKQSNNRNLKHEAIIIDDIVTTGSTMSSCVYALKKAKVSVISGFSLACVSSSGDGTEDYK